MAGARPQGFLLIAALVALPACWSFGDDPEYQSDDPAPEEPCRADGGPPPPGPFVCNGQCEDHVVDKLVLPLTSGDAQKYSVMHQEKKYNALGNILALIAQQAGGAFTPQACTDRLINMGRIVTLFRLRDPGLLGGLGSGAKQWLGHKKACCPKAQSWGECEKESPAVCFSGKGAFDADTSTEALFGSWPVKSKALWGARAHLRVSLDCNTVVTLPLIEARIEGVLKDGKIVDGVIGGGIRRKDVQAVVYPWLARGLDAAYKSGDSQTAGMIRQLFDTNGDFSIDADEVANNPLVKTFLSGDVDLDCDGQNELSLGLGFSTVRAVIKD